jgi:GxxExxY protein
VNGDNGNRLNHRNPQHHGGKRRDPVQVAGPEQRRIDGRRVHGNPDRDFALADKLSNKVIGLAIEVHRALGPGLLESAYRQCLEYELAKHGIRFTSEQPIPVKYKETMIGCAFRADIVVENSVILELKAADKILPIHEAQLITYLRLTGLRLGLIINFNTKLLKNGIKRIVL